jgi:hypothetical protein
MKILVVRQPWAYLIVHGLKPIENRSWATNYRGPVLIQAASRFSKPDMQAAREYASARGIAIPDVLPVAGVVGIVELTDCVSSHESPWFEGPYGWVLNHARVLPFVPCSGQLGLMNVPEEIMRQLPTDVQLLDGR